MSAKNSFSFDFNDFLQDLVLLDLLRRPAAYPQRFDCNYACMAGLAPGGSFGNMGIPNFASTTGSNCVITTSVTHDAYCGRFG